MARRLPRRVRHGAEARWCGWITRRRWRRDGLRADLVAAIRTETPADPKGTFRFHPACGVCMERRADWLFKERLWPALESVPASRLRWITVLMFVYRDLDDGVREMKRQHRRLQHVLRKFAGGAGKSPRAKVRVWGAREVEPSDNGWMFHTHLLVDFAGADPRRLGNMLRAAWGGGSRQVQIKVMQQREHRANIIRLAHYMTKARYTRDVGVPRREWLSNEEIVTVALWRDRQPAQWHRFTWAVRGV